MYIKINEEKINKIEEMTTTDYEYRDGGISVEVVESLIDDLLLEIDKLENRIKELNDEIDNNYTLKEVDQYEFNGISRSDFY